MAKHETQADAGGSDPGTAEKLLAKIEELERRLTEREAKPDLPDEAVTAQERRKAQKEAAKAPHPHQKGSLRHKQKLRDGTEVQCQSSMKNGKEEFEEIPISFVNTPKGRIIDASPLHEFGGKYL